MLVTSLISTLTIVLVFCIILFVSQKNRTVTIGSTGSPVLSGDEFSTVYNPPEGEYTQEELLNISLYEMLNEGVVNINTTVMSYNFFLEPVPKEGASGSGSIIDGKGYVLTNYHVVKGAQQVYINLADGSQFEGEVIGTDRENDLSIVKFDPEGKDLTVIPFGTSSNLKVGQKVLAIGNPYGLERTMSTGIVSALGTTHKE